MKRLLVRNRRNQCNAASLTDAVKMQVDGSLKPRDSGKVSGWALGIWGGLGQQLAQYIYEWLTSSIKISRRGSANNASACLAKA